MRPTNPRPPLRQPSEHTIESGAASLANAVRRGLYERAAIEVREDSVARRAIEMLDADPSGKRLGLVRVVRGGQRKSQIVRGCRR